MRKPSIKQTAIIEFMLQKNSMANFDELIDRFGGWYYHNERKHLSALLSRMVKSGYIKRIGKGVFQLHRHRSGNLIISDNQLELFGDNEMTEDVQKEFILNNYDKVPLREMARIIGRSRCFIHGEMKRQGLIRPKSVIEKFINDNRYQKGHKPANAGKSMETWASQETIEKFRKNQFAKGNEPHNTKFDGAISLRKMKNGYKYFWIRISKKKWMLYHRYLWQQVHGEIDENILIQFKDGDTLNVDIDNLYVTNRVDQVRINQKGGAKVPHHLKESILLINKLKMKIHEKQND